jgi:hypothetical protein
MVLVQALHELSDRNIGIIAVHQINIDVVGAQSFQRFEQLGSYKFWRATSGGGAFADEHDPATESLFFDPGSHALFGVAEPIDPSGVDTVSAAFVKEIEQRKREW